LEKFDCDLWGHLFQGPPDLLSGVCEPIGVNVNSNAATPADHVSALLETRDRLLELMPALRALESDQVRVTHGTRNSVGSPSVTSQGFPLCLIEAAAPLTRRRRSYVPALFGSQASEKGPASARPFCVGYNEQLTSAAQMAS
jgi:hypothetical protein